MKKNREYNMMNKVRGELSISDKNNRILMRGSRIVIPKTLRRTAINLAHGGHQGIVKTKQLLRDTVWFPGIDRMTEEVISTLRPELLVLDVY